MNKKNNKFNDFYKAWQWLNTTDVFWHSSKENLEFWERNNFTDSLMFIVVKVNPKTNRIDDKEYKNTKTQIWLECGEPVIKSNNFDILDKIEFCHNTDYDCSGDTFEEAIINLANIVYNYNN